MKVMIWENGEPVYKDKGTGKKVKKNFMEYLRFKE